MMPLCALPPSLLFPLLGLFPFGPTSVKQDDKVTAVLPLLPSSFSPSLSPVFFFFFFFPPHVIGEKIKKKDRD